MRNRYIIAALAGAALMTGLVAGCGGSAASSPGVPTLSQAAGQGSPGQGPASSRAAALHAAAQCIRQHGIPAYADPVLTAGGQVYSDRAEALRA
jgi:hypothetical protein